MKCVVVVVVVGGGYSTDVCVCVIVSGFFCLRNPKKRKVT